MRIAPDIQRFEVNSVPLSAVILFGYPLRFTTLSKEFCLVS